MGDTNGTQQDVQDNKEIEKLHDRATEVEWTQEQKCQEKEWGFK